MLQVYYRLLKHKTMLYDSLQSLKVSSTVLGTDCIFKKKKNPYTWTDIFPNWIPPLLLWHDSLYNPKKICFLFLPHPSKCSSVKMSLQLEKSTILTSQMRQEIAKDHDSSDSEGGNNIQRQNPETTRHHSECFKEKTKAGGWGKPKKYLQHLMN